MSLRKEGYLEKRGHIIKNWKLRWFILDGVCLTYTENNKTKRLCGRINLERAKIEESSELMKRPYTFALSCGTGEKKVFYITAPNTEEYQDWYNTLSKILKELEGAEIANVTISKSVLDFNLGDQPCPLGEPMFDDLIIFNNSLNRVSYKISAPIGKTYDLFFTPNSGLLNKFESVCIRTKITVTDNENINVRVNVNIDDESKFVYVKCRSAVGIFGTNPNDLEQTEDLGHKIPLILLQMKNCLLDSGGVKQEGIFRIAGEASDIKRVKILINQNKFTGGAEDPNTIATLMKIWFRDLPDPVLNAIPSDDIHNSSDLDICIRSYEAMREPHKSLLDWLLDFLMMITSYSSVNKMSLQNIAIVIAPNLYESRESDPMEGLVLSQKCAQFLHHILQWKMQTSPPPAPTVRASTGNLPQVDRESVDTRRSFR